MTSKIPQTMRAWQYTTNSGPVEKRLQLNTTAALPQPKPDQHLVRVVAATIQPVDYKPADISFISRFAIPKPATPGMDFAGYIVTPAKDSSLKPGQAVFGVTGASIFSPGSLREYATTDIKTTVAVPEGVSLVDAATIGVAGETAYQTIVPKLKAGQKVFVNGGSGGVGTFHIQVAKAVGCHVTTACSTANVELCKSLGADNVIDYKKGSVAKALKASGHKFDRIIDNVSYDSTIYFACDKFTNPGAEYVMIGGRPQLSFMGMMLKISLWPGWLGGGKRKCTGFFAVPKVDEMERIANWMREGKVKAVIDSRFAFEDAPKAFERSRTGRARGKIVVEVASQGKA